MFLAQVDPVVTSSAAGAFAEKFGFPALLVIILLLGLWKLFNAAAAERKELDTACRDERKEDREAHMKAMVEHRDAHLAVLGKHTEVIMQLGAGLTRLELKVDNLDRDVSGLKTRQG